MFVMKSCNVCMLSYVLYCYDMMYVMLCMLCVCYIMFSYDMLCSVV